MRLLLSSILYVVLAILGIDFLILIHELGHFYMARKLGITVEEFAVGFGKSIFSWTRKGVKYKVGIIPFGGYVKMAGMEKKGVLDPHLVKGGFLAQKPWDQIKVASMGPLVNIVFAFVAFSFLWLTGGLEKPFSEFSKHIGWISQESAPYTSEIRAGDIIQKVNNQRFQNFENFLYSAITDRGPLTMSGLKVNWFSGSETPFTYVFDGDKKLESMDKAASVLNTLEPAQYLMYDQMPNGAPNKLVEGSPLENSGIQYGDQIVWVDGKLIFSKRELIETINEPCILLTVKREGKTFLTRIPLLKVGDLRLTAQEKEEIDDFRDAAKIDQKVDNIKYIPYNLTASLEVEESIPYIDHESRSKSAFEAPKRTQSEIALLPGDKILAASGSLVKNSEEFIKEVQKKKVLIIVDHNKEKKPIYWKDTEKTFNQSFNISEIRKIFDTIGTDEPLRSTGSLRLLNPVTPIRLQEFPLPKAQANQQKQRVEKRNEEITQIKDSKIREQATRELELYQNRLMLGITLQDRLVAYNPSSFFMMRDVFGQIVKTFKSLVTGSLSPKYMAGPIGIVQVIQFGWSQGVKEALFFLGMISLNLGILNLLPIPVLDGGHIVFALWEKIRKKPLPIKTRERLIFPFIVILILIFVYFSFNDVIRIVTRFF